MAALSSNQLQHSIRRGSRIANRSQDENRLVDDIIHHSSDLLKDILL